MPWRYHPALDGVRMVAVYLVLLFHAGLSWTAGGFIGVDLFFCLSGFVVSGVILSEIDETGTLRLGRFYARRVRRLLPAAVAVVIATCGIFLLVTSLVRRLQIVGDAQSALLYVANWRFLSQPDGYFQTGADQSPFLHFWSLAVEEQFYVVFPLVLLGLTMAVRRYRGALLGGLTALLVLSLGAQLFWAQVDASHAYYGTDARLYQLVAGAVLAVVLRRFGGMVTERAGTLGAVTGMGGLLLLGSGLLDFGASWRGIGAAAASVLLVGGVVVGGGRLTSALARPVPVYLGRISYGTYLWHWPVILVLQEALHVDPWVIAVLAGVLGTSLAALSFELFEMPIRRSALLARVRWRTVVTGVVTSAVVAVTLVPWALEQDRKPALAGPEATTDAKPVAATHQKTTVPSDVDWKAIREQRFPQYGCTAKNTKECMVAKGSGLHVMVIGDSHAMMLLPMFKKLAQKHGFTLSANVLAGCMWQEGLVHTRPPKERQQQCTKQRVGWYDKALPKLDPDIVILAGLARDDPDKAGQWVQRRDGKMRSLHQATLRASKQTVAKINKVVPRVLVVEPIITPEDFDPLKCLSGAKQPSKCAVPVTPGTTESNAFFTAAAARSKTVQTVNLNKAFCPDAPVCQPVVDGTVVWRDPKHLNAEFATQQRGKVWQLIKQTGFVDQVKS